MTDFIEIHPTSSQDSSYSEHYLVFFITGNPGLISYYSDFFNTLHHLLHSSTASSDAIFHLVGKNLAGFGGHDGPPYSLESVITAVRNNLSEQRIPEGPQKYQHYKGVILIGHSVGSYILLELIRQSKLEPDDATKGDCRDVNIIAGVCLFPTVTHIAKSPNGLKISLLFRIPNFPRIASFLAKLLIFSVPNRLLKYLVRLVTGMPDAAVKTTMQFLTSKGGIYQALYLAKDEMEIIKEYKWEEDIWEIENPKRDTQIPKLIFYFGENDHWVANHTRDELIAARGQVEGKSKPLMFIDQEGVPHGFCIDHSETIAEKVKVWIDDIVGDT